MKALVVHNYYRSANASGENISVTDEIAGLRALGWDVEVLSSDSNVIESGHVPLTEMAIRPIYSGRSIRRVHESINRFRPHVALIENVFPLHSPAIVGVLQRAGIPVAAGVRSYRMWCAASTLYREGAPCNECVGSALNLPAIRHGCYQNSPYRSVPMAASLRLHRSTFRRLDAYLAVTDYVRDQLVAAGMPADRIVVRPNFVPDPGEPDSDSTGTGFLFAGRLSDEKGVPLMLDAWERSEVWKSERLAVAGSGELAERVRSVPERLSVDALGLVDHDELLDRIRAAAVMVVPSVWPEPFGRGVIEASSLSRPSLVTRSGGLTSLVSHGETGWIADADADALATGFRQAADEQARSQAGPAARRRFVERYTRDVSLGILDDTLRRLALRS